MSKGLTDLVVLLARPGTDVHALELAGAGNHERDAGTLLDPTARAAYRRRLTELDTYPIGIKYTNKQVEALPITRHDFHGEWNYTRCATRRPVVSPIE